MHVVDNPAARKPDGVEVSLPERLVSDADHLSLSRVSSTVQTRHICSGMRFIHRGNDQATGSTLLTVFMHDGDGRGPAVPAVVGEDTDEFVRTDVGWRFASRTFETLFA